MAGLAFDALTLTMHLVEPGELRQQGGRLQCELAGLEVLTKPPQRLAVRLYFCEPELNAPLVALRVAREKTGELARGFCGCGSHRRLATPPREHEALLFFAAPAKLAHGLSDDPHSLINRWQVQHGQSMSHLPARDSRARARA